LHGVEIRHDRHEERDGHGRQDVRQLREAEMREIHAAHCGQDRFQVGHRAKREEPAHEHPARDLEPDLSGRCFGRSGGGAVRGQMGGAPGGEIDETVIHGGFLADASGNPT